MLATLIELTPYDPVTAGTVTLRACSADDAALTSLNGVTWWPAIARRPRLTVDGFDGNFGGAITTGAGDVQLLTIPTGALTVFANAARYEWSDKRARIWTGQVGAAWGSFTLLFDGLVQGNAKIARGRVSLGLKVNDSFLDRPLLNLSYGGTGGSDGPAALKGTPKPLIIGAPQFVEPVLVDAVNNVHQLSGYGAIHGVTALFDRLVQFGASIGDFATYAALVAASIPASGWGTCLAEGLIRTGAPPAGTLTAHCEGDSGSAYGWVRKPGAVISRLASIAGATGGQIDSASMTTLDTTVPYNLSLSIQAQTSARDIIQKIAASANASAGVSWLGKLYAAPVGIGASALTLKTDGSTLPPVAAVESLGTAAPYWRMQMAAAITWRVHSASEIAFTADLVEVGDYAGGTTYREGNISVNQGARWLYINPVASAGNAPPTLPTTSNSYWSLLSLPTDYSTIAGAKPTAQTFRVRTRGLSAALPGGDTHVGLWNEDTNTQIAGFGQMYVVAFYNVITKTWSSQSFDTLTNPTVTSTVTGTSMDSRSAMAYLLADLNNNFAGYPVVVYTYDEPSNGRFGGSPFDIANQMYRAGASRAVFGSAKFTFRNAYLLVGICASGEGNGAEYLAGAGVSASTEAIIDVGFTMTPSGVLSVAGKTPSLADDLVYSSGVTIEALKPAMAGSTRNIVTYSISAPSSPIDGDLWVDTGGTYAIFKLRSGGAWVTGANALTTYNALSGTPVALADINTTESSKLAGIAANATRNVVTYSTSAPGSPVDGDLWVDTSGTFAVFKLRVSGVWSVGANALSAYTALTGKPVALADINTTESTKLTGIATGATKNTVTYSGTAPASPTDGDIWVDTSVTPNVQKVRVSGAWQAGANLVTQGTDIGVANGATKNVVTYSATAPASPVNGVDIWVDTSVTPNITKYRVGGAWVAGANYVTQGTDIGVENGATLNNAADEMNRNSSFEIYTGSAFPGWAFYAVHPGVGSSGVFAVATGFDLGRGPTMLYVSGDTYFWSEAMPVTPGETLWVEVAYYVDKGTGGTQTMGDTAGVVFSARFGASSPFGGTDTFVVNAAVSYPMNRQVVLAQITVPTGMLSMALLGWLDYGTSGTQSKMFVGNFSVSRRQPGADVTATQPVVQRLSTATGQALANFVLANGLNPASIVAAGFNRDGDSVSFASTLAAVPKIFFLPGGNAATAGQNVSIQAVGLTTSGFTMKAKSQAVTPGSLVTDGSATTGGGANPDKVINRTSSSHPYDNQFKFNFSVTVGNISAGEPGQVEVAIYVKQSGAWSNVGGQSYSATGTYDLSAFVTTVDFGAGDEFGISVVYAEGTGSVLSAFHNVKYTPGSVTETSLTPTGASDIPWIAIL